MAALYKLLAETTLLVESTDSLDESFGLIPKRSKKEEVFYIRFNFYSVFKMHFIEKKSV